MATWVWRHVRSVFLSLGADVGGVCSIFFASGINTLLQTTWGDRLPIIQGGSFSFLTPAFAIISNVKDRGGFDCAPDAPSCSPRFKVRNRPPPPPPCLSQALSGWLGTYSTNSERMPQIQHACVTLFRRPVAHPPTRSPTTSVSAAPAPPLSQLAQSCRYPI